MAAASTLQARTARAAAARSRTPRDRAGTRSLGPAARVRWDRLGRLAMLFVLMALLYLYLSAGVHMLSSWGQARKDSSAVVALEREHKALVRQHEALGRQGTVEEEARRLGMMKKGEQPYIVSGLPNN